MMKKKTSAYDQGYANGYAAASDCEVDGTDKRDAGCNCPDVCAECLTAAAYDTELNARQYAGHHDPMSDAQWERYDAGIDAGVRRGVRDRLARESQ